MSRASPVVPNRRTLSEEGIDAFAGIERQHVGRHDLGGIAIGGGEVELGLAVERLLADCNGKRGFAGDLAGEAVDRLAQPGPRGLPG